MKKSSRRLSIKRLSFEFFGLFRTHAIILALLAPLALSCTRNRGHQTSFRIEMPDWQKTLKKSVSSFGTDDVSVVRKPGRIMINISGPGISEPIVQIWESRDKINAQPPAAFEFQVPRGENRVIQVLAITRDFYFLGDQMASTGKDTFFYGDVKKPLVNSVESIEITLQEVTLGEGGEGVVSGRWIDADGNGPTGLLTMKYVPPNAPPMVVHRTEIHGGWFEVPAIAGGKFTYELEDGTPLFSNFDIGNPGLTWGDERVWIKVPTGYKNIYGFGSTPVARWETSPVHIVLGYFGPGASGKKVCYPDQTGKLPGLYVSPDLNSNTEVEWSTSGPSATTAGVLAGGAPASACTSQNTRFIDWLFPNPTSLLNGGRRAAKFQGVFQSLNDPSSPDEKYVEIAYNAATSQVDLSWKYLPGTTGPERISGIEIFTRVVPEDFNADHDNLYEDDGVACNRLTNPMYFPLLPFTSRGRFAVQGTDLQAVSITGLTEGEFERTQIVLCPYSNERPGYFTAGYVHRKESFGGGGGPFKEIRLNLVNAISKHHNIAAYDCEEVKITFYQDGVETVVEDGLAVQLSEASSTAFYTDAACSTAPVTEATIPAGFSSATLYWKSQMWGVYDLRAWTDTIGGRSQRVAVTDPYGYSATDVRIEFEWGGVTSDTHHYVVGKCYPIAINLYGANNSLTNNQSLTANISHTGTGKLYDQPNCEGLELSTLEFPVNVASRVVYLKPEGVIGQVYEIKASVSGLPESNTWKYDVASATVTQLEVQLSNQFDDEIAVYLPDAGCMQAFLHPKAANGTPLPFTSSKTATLTTSDGAFLLSNSDDCANPSSSIQVQLYPNSHNGRSEPFWIKIQDPNKATGTIAASVTSPNVNTTSTLYKKPSLLLSNLPSVMVQGICYPFSAVLNLADGTTFPFPTGKVARAYVSVYNGDLFTNAQCTEATTHIPVNFSNGATAMPLWVRAFGSGAMVSSALSNYPDVSESKTPTVTRPLLGAMVNNGDPFDNTETCVPLQITVSPAGLPETIIIDWIMVGGSIVQTGVYTDSSCVNSAGPVTIDAGQAYSQMLFFKPQPGFTSGTYTISFSGVHSQSGNPIEPENTEVSATCSSGVCPNQPN